MGLTSGSVEGGASGGAGAEATAVLMAMPYKAVESQLFPVKRKGVTVYLLPRLSATSVSPALMKSRVAWRRLRGEMQISFEKNAVTELIGLCLVCKGVQCGNGV